MTKVGWLTIDRSCWTSIFFQDRGSWCSILIILLTDFTEICGSAHRRALLQRKHFVLIGLWFYFNLICNVYLSWYISAIDLRNLFTHFSRDVTTVFSLYRIADLASHLLAHLPGHLVADLLGHLVTLLPWYLAWHIPALLPCHLLTLLTWNLAALLSLNLVAFLTRHLAGNNKNIIRDNSLATSYDV